MPPAHSYRWVSGPADDSCPRTAHVCRVVEQDEPPRRIVQPPRFSCVADEPGRALVQPCHQSSQIVLLSTPLRGPHGIVRLKGAGLVAWQGSGLLACISLCFELCWPGRCRYLHPWGPQCGGGPCTAGSPTREGVIPKGEGALSLCRSRAFAFEWTRPRRFSLLEYRFALPIEKEIKGWRYLIYAKRIGSASHSRQVRTGAAGLLAN